MGEEAYESSDLEVSGSTEDDEEDDGADVHGEGGLEASEDVVARRGAVLPSEHVWPEPLVRESLGRIEEGVLCDF